MLLQDRLLTISIILFGLGYAVTRSFSFGLLGSVIGVSCYRLCYIHISAKKLPIEKNIIVGLIRGAISEYREERRINGGLFSKILDVSTKVQQTDGRLSKPQAEVIAVLAARYHYGKKTINDEVVHFFSKGKLGFLNGVNSAWRKYNERF